MAHATPRPTGNSATAAMGAAPVDGVKDNDAVGKAPNVLVKSEIVDVVNDDYTVPQDTGTACGDPLVAFGSVGGRFADDVRFPEYEDANSTECSSSFDASDSLSDDNVESDMGAMKVDSIFQSHTNIDNTTVVPHLLRKRKVTAEWRKYIGPVMWRCQWLELRMKDLLSQVEKYDKELAVINHEKDLQLEMMKADCPQLDHERNTMKRRKSKRDEDIMDSLSTEKHLILSYHNENQKKKTETDELLDDDVNSLAVENKESSLGLTDMAWLELKENDTVLEQYSLREILFSINEMQSRIVSLQNHLSDALNTTDHSQKAKKVQKKKKLHSLLQKDIGSDVTKPDEDKVTIEMLFGTHSPLIDAHLKGLYNEIADDVLIDNQAAREEGYWQSERVSQKVEKQVVPVQSVDETPSSEEKISALMRHASVSISAPIVNKRGPKPKNKHSTKKKKMTEGDFDNSNLERTMLVAVDTRRSQRVRKPKTF